MRGAGSSRVTLNPAFRFDQRGCFPVPTWHRPAHGAQGRGWEERSHAQHREAPDLPRSEHRGRLTASRVLRLAPALLALFESIAVAVHFEAVDVVGQPIEQRAGQPLGPEHAGPLVERQIAGDESGAALVTLAESRERNRLQLPHPLWKATLNRQRVKRTRQFVTLASFARRIGHRDRNRSAGTLARA
jgi:hypothetical protein